MAQLKPRFIRFTRGQDWWAVLSLIVLAGLFGGIVNYRRIAYPTNNDYSTHVLYTQQMHDGQFDRVPDINLAHPGLQLILLGLSALTFHKLGFYGSLIILQTAVYVLTALILYFVWFGSRGSGGGAWKRAFWALTLTFVAPVMALVVLDQKYYFGYIGLANYHNPTIHLLRPVALLGYLFAARSLSRTRSSWGAISVAATLMVFSALVKPSFAATILPGLGIMAAVHLSRRKAVDWKMLIFGFYLPAGVVLAAQWIFVFLRPAGESGGILFRPFEVEAAFSDYLLPKFLLSVLFPLSALSVYRRKLIHEVDWQLAGVTFLVGAAQMYFLAEGGERFYHGNFRWGAQIALFLLFAVTIRHVYFDRRGSAHFTGKEVGSADYGEQPSQPDPTGEPRTQQESVLRPRPPGTLGKGVVLVAYLAHVMAAAAYYVHVLLSTDYG